MLKYNTTVFSAMQPEHNCAAELDKTPGSSKSNLLTSPVFAVYPLTVRSSYCDSVRHI